MTYPTTDPDVPARPVDPVVLLAKFEALLREDGIVAGLWYDRAGVLEAMRTLLGRMDIPTVGEAESTRIARRVAGLVDGGR